MGRGGAFVFVKQGQRTTREWTEQQARKASALADAEYRCLVEVAGLCRVRTQYAAPANVFAGEGARGGPKPLGVDFPIYAEYVPVCEACWRHILHVASSSTRAAA